MQSFPFVKSLRFNEPIRSGEENIAVLTAEWPNPSWHLTEVTSEIDTGKRRIIIKVIGQRGSGIAAMVIRPFNETLKISIPETGKWEIVVKGRAGDLTQTIIAN